MHVIFIKHRGIAPLCRGGGVSEGWIKIHRKLAEWGWASEPNMMSLWVHLLLAASIKDTNYRGQTVKRGDVIFGLAAWSKKTGISIQSLRTCLERLKSTNEITSKSTNRFTVITIVKYEEYQEKLDGLTSKSTGSSTINQQSTNNQLTTSKECKNIRNIDDDDTRTREKNSKSDFQKIFEAGCESFPHLQAKNAAPIHAWIAEGCDPELDAVPVFHQCKASGSVPRGWQYFAPMIADSIRLRHQPLPQPQPPASNGRGSYQAQLDSDRQLQRDVAQQVLAKIEREKRGGSHAQRN